VRQDALDALALAQTRMAIQFDKDHTPPFFQGQVWLKLVKAGSHGYRLPASNKLSPIRTGPFQIIRRVGNLAYELDLPKTMRIHPVMSCIHLEQYEEDPHGRKLTPPAPLVVDRTERWIIEKLVRQRRRVGCEEILVKWKGYKEKTWESRANLGNRCPGPGDQFRSSEKP
jgi:hypothetical protein